MGLSAKFVRYLLLFLFAGASLIVISVVLTLSLYQLLGLGEEEGDGNSKYTYRYHMLNPDTNETASGFVTTLKEVDDFVSYTDKRGNNVLISAFGSEEFQCVGSCYCENPRRASMTLTRSISLLVASVSAVVAVGIAKNQFEDECRIKMADDDCPEEWVRSKVDECKQLEERLEELRLGLNVPRKVTYQEFFCRGNCVTSHFGLQGINEGYLIDKGGAGVCEAMHLESEVRIMESDSNFYLGYKNLAEVHFLKYYLNLFCKEKGKVTTYEKLLTRTGKEIKLEVDKSVCDGEVAQGITNPTVNCVSIVK